MLCFNLLGFLLVLSGFLGTALAIDVSTVFDIQKGPLFAGGCDVYGNDVSTFLNDAIKILQAGYDGFVDLRKGVSGASSVDDWQFENRAAENIWQLDVNAAGMAIPPQQGLRGNTQAAMDPIRDAMNFALDNLNNGNHNFQNGAVGSISCGGDGVVYVGPDALNPLYAEQYNFDDKNNDWPTMRESNYPFGALYHHFSRGLRPLTAGMSTDPGDYLCDNTQNAAMTAINWHTIFLCPRMFDRTNYIADLNVAANGCIPPAEGQEYGMSLFYIQHTSAVAMAHELLHFYDHSIIDYPAISRVPTREPQPALFGPVLPMMAPGRRQRNCYGYQECAFFSHYYPQLAQNNADHYATWSFIMWLYNYDGQGTGWDYHSGMCQPKANGKSPENHVPGPIPHPPPPGNVVKARDSAGASELRHAGRYNLAARKALTNATQVY